MEKLKLNGGDNLKSGFRETGIYPLDKQQVLDRLPNQVILYDADGSGIMEVISQSFIDHFVS